MWPELKREISVERESLDRLLAMLHSFYTGIENLFKRVAIHLDQGMLQGEMWHSRMDRR